MMHDWDGLIDHFDDDDREEIDVEKERLHNQMSDKKPQDIPYWHKSKSQAGVFFCNLWCRDKEIEMFVVETMHRWGWFATEGGMDGKRLAGSMAVRYSHPEACFFEASMWLDKQREGY